MSPQTVFNYFPTKEDLFYSRLEAFEDKLLSAVRDRAPGESVLKAFGRFVLSQHGLLQDDDATAQLRTVTRVITGSPALLARERQVLADYTDALAAGALAEAERGGTGRLSNRTSSPPALIGVHRSLIEYVRRRVAAGASSGGEIGRDVREQAERALRPARAGVLGYMSWQ